MSFFFGGGGVGLFVVDVVSQKNDIDPAHLVCSCGRLYAQENRVRLLYLVFDNHLL